MPSARVSERPGGRFPQSRSWLDPGSRSMRSSSCGRAVGADAIVDLVELHRRRKLDQHGSPSAAPAVTVRVKVLSLTVRALAGAP